MRRAACAAALAVLLACGAPAPRPIVYGSEECAHCHMIVIDPRYAAELVTAGGRVVVFDDIGCLVAYLRQGTVSAADVHSTWAADYLHAGPALHETSLLRFVRAQGIRTPMNSRLLAVADDRAADSVAAALDGTRLSWGEVRAGEEAGR